MKPLEPDDPQKLGQYRLLRMLGAGGMGKVFLGRSPQGRIVAVKLIHPQFALDPAFRSRFQREIAAAQRVGGEWTAPVLDSDTEGPIPWVATDYIAGPPLYDIVTQFGVLPEATLWRLAEGLAHALTAIHDSGLVHRDLKPSNVLATVDGPRVIDFGIARAVDASVLTRTGTVVGSPGYMSPEQVRGERLDAASDVFSLGATLTYAATGAGPFDTEDGSGHALMYRVINEAPNLGNLAGPLRDLVAACLAKHPGERPTPRDIATAALAHRTSGPWLPPALTDQLLRDTVQLLTIEEPERGEVAEPPAEPPSAPGDAPSAVSSVSSVPPVSSVSSETMHLRLPEEPARNQEADAEPPAPSIDAPVGSPSDTMQLRVVEEPPRDRGAADTEPPVPPHGARRRATAAQRRRPDVVLVALSVVATVVTVLLVVTALRAGGGDRGVEADATTTESAGSAEDGSADDSPGRTAEGSEGGESGRPSGDPSGSPSDDASGDGDSDGGDTSGGTSDGGSSSGGSDTDTSGGSSDGSSGGSSDGSSGGSSDGSSGGSSDGSSGGDGSDGGSSDGSSGGGSDGGSSGGGGLNDQVDRDMVGTWESSSDVLTYDGSSWTIDLMGCFYTLELASVSDAGRSVHLNGTSGGCGTCDVNFWLEGADTAGMNAFDSYGGAMSASMYRV
ncbi:serine/threonine-protein kinase [Streptomyces sp. B6B3]|uniref:serine/threonine-protein kinase n=1 Tax=Streptomyces sp. B6B3 TaxID=3153570 RepID=UPI00325D67D4